MANRKARAPRRRWPDAEVTNILASYEQLPKQNGARADWLRERKLSTAQLCIWRRKRRAELPAAPPAVGNLEGVVGFPAPPITIVDGPDVSAVIAQLLAQKDACALRCAQIERAVAALRELEAVAVAKGGS